MKYVLIPAIVAVALVGCSNGNRPVRAPLGVNCLGMADDLKTLKVGDELPRVMQVLGEPQRMYRAYSPFGNSYDVMEYDTGNTPCVKAVLHAGKKLQVVFDSKGQFVGAGDNAAFIIKRATTVRVQKLVVDPVVFKP